MSFMSTAPRPQTQPSRSSPENGWTLHSAASAGTTSRWPCTSSGGRLRSVPSIRATRLARPGSDSTDLRLDADLGELAGDVLGGGPLGMLVGLVVSIRIRSQQQLDDLVLRWALVHARIPATRPARLGHRRPGAGQSGRAHLVRVAEWQTR